MNNGYKICSIAKKVTGFILKKKKRFFCFGTRRSSIRKNFAKKLILASLRGNSVGLHHTCNIFFIIYERVVAMMQWGVFGPPLHIWGPPVLKTRPGPRIFFNTLQDSKRKVRSWWAHKSRCFRGYRLTNHLSLGGQQTHLYI